MTSGMYSKYADQIRSLNVKMTNGVKAPHKAIMLIAIIDMINNGKLKRNEILLNNEIAENFKECWEKYVSPNPIFNHFICAVWTPFWHLKKELFWHFRAISPNKDIEHLVPAGQTASIGKMRNHIRYAYLDESLFELLRDSECRSKMRELLLN